ncbi:MAG: S9 family peptidase [Saprospiraceae bacterium]|nr:S9 family peptidase [Saprospiraceae bacterium]
MKSLIFLILIILIVSCVEPSSDTREIETYTIEQFYNNKSIFGGSFSADEERLLVTSNETGIYNIYALDLTSGSMQPLTSSSENSIFGISYFPNDDRILYSSDKGGNEISHLYLRNPDGESIDLTPDSLTKAQFLSWAHDEESFFYLSNQRDQRYFDLFEVQINDLDDHIMIYENKENLTVSGISNDRSYLALTRSITTTQDELFLFDLKNNSTTRLSSDKTEATYSPQFFSNDSRYLYCLTDEHGEFASLVRYDLSSGNQEPVYSTNWDVWYAYDSYNEKYRVIGVNEDGKTSVKVLDQSDGSEVDFPDFESAEVNSVSISRSEALMRFSVGSSKSPSDLYLYNFETGDHKQLTHSLNPEINIDDLVDGQVVRFESFDGTVIPSIFYKPLQAGEGNKVPALVWVHGGPGGQSRQTYSPLIQYLVNHGYAIMAINNRGSSGYGKTFFKLDDQRHGEDDLKDCVEGKNWLASQDFIDPGKIGIAGGSYGGYMVMAALTFTPEEFAVGVNIFGVTNWLRTLKSIPPYWESFRTALYTELGDPFTADSVRLHRISPLFHAENVRKPLMVLQGANDPRVLQVESDEIVAAVRENGVPVEYVLFDDEGHGFVKKENQIKGYGQVLDFLNQYLKEQVN